MYLTRADASFCGEEMYPGCRDTSCGDGKVYRICAERHSREKMVLRDGANECSWWHSIAPAALIALDHHDCRSFMVRFNLINRIYNLCYLHRVTTLCRSR